MKRFSFIIPFFFLLLLLAIALSFNSCNKKIKTVVCHYSIFYHDLGLGFKGFDTADVKILIWEAYEKGSGFTALISSDTLVTDSFFQEGAYIFKDNPRNPDLGLFFTINDKNDFALRMPALKKSVYFSDVHSGERAHYFEIQGEHCSPGAGQARFRPFFYNTENTGSYTVFIDPTYQYGLSKFIVTIEK